MEIGKKVVWAEGGMGRGYQADGPQFLLVCGAEGGLGGHNQVSNVALAEK